MAAEEGIAVTTRSRTICLSTALLCALLGFLLQFVIVNARYGGNWTGLFCTGSKWPAPPALSSEQLYIFSRSTGYDGQMYHYVAHDPLLQSEIVRYLDNPRVRYQRILLPATAFLLAGGRQAWIDQSYISANLIFLFLGAWWLSRYLDSAGLQPRYAMLFLLSPAALIALDRLTLDLTFTALCVGFALYVRLGHDSKAYVILMLACLCRDTGLVLAGASCLALVFQGRFKKAATWATSAIPAVTWYVYVNSRVPESSGNVLGQLIPFKGVLGALLAPLTYPFGPGVSALLSWLDRLSLLGILVAVLLSVWMVWRHGLGQTEAAMLAWGFIVLCLPRDFWLDAVSGPRVFAPLLMYVLLPGDPPARWSSITPTLMVLPRIGLEIGVPLLSALLRRG